MAIFAGVDDYKYSFRNMVQSGLLFYFNSFIPDSRHTLTRLFSQINNIQITRMPNLNYIFYPGNISEYPYAYVAVEPDGITKMDYPAVIQDPVPTGSWYPSAGTICIWIKILCLYWGGWYMWLQQGSNSSAYYIWKIGIEGVNGYSPDGKIYGGNSYTNTIYPANTWAYICQTWIDDGSGNKTTNLYYNGNMIRSEVITFPTQTDKNPIFIGSTPNTGYPTIAPSPSKVSLPIIQFYNRNLSSSEILQNFNAMRKRFKV